MASQNYAALFDTAIDKHILASFDEWESVIPDLFHVSSTKRRFEEHQGWTGYGLPQFRFPGEQIVQGEIHENYNKRYTMRSFGLGDALPIEDVEDDPTGMLTQGAAKIAGGLSASFTDSVETDMANFFINGFTSTAGTPDGVALFSTSHPLAKSNSGTLWANRPTSGVDISISAVQGAITNIRTQLAPNGRPMRNSPRVLWYHPQLRFIVFQILKQQMEVGTADNNTNFIRDFNIIPVETPFLLESGSPADAWGIIGREHFLNFIWRNRFRAHNDFDPSTKSYLVFGDIRYDLGHDDARGTFASPGA